MTLPGLHLKPTQTPINTMRFCTMRDASFPRIHSALLEIPRGTLSAPRAPCAFWGIAGMASWLGRYKKNVFHPQTHPHPDNWKFIVPRYASNQNEMLNNYCQYVTQANGRARLKTAQARISGVRSGQKLHSCPPTGQPDS